ncbi:MAG TPA: hypothetical protein VIM85_00680 [Pseudomonadales bacterium]
MEDTANHRRLVINGDVNQAAAGYYAKPKNAAKERGVQVVE